ncbi:MAG: bifunctional precorrin-2 dehydrogenase/sirohydrochlorin ferrochelatase [Desulfobacterales bacterium]
MAEMTYYPVCLDIRNRPCLVVGGGAVALRKAEGLLAAGANVTVVSPEFVDGFSRIPPEAPLYRIQRPYADTDLNEKFLVIGATDNSALNRQISRDANSRNMLCNIADVPEACNFVLPAVVRRGDLLLAISTSGKSPAFARHLRKQLENQFGVEYTEFLRLMGAIRQKLLAAEHAPEAHKPLFEQLIDGGLLEMISAGRIADIDELLSAVLGPGYDYRSLMASAEEEN